MNSVATHSTSSAPGAIVGRTEPRLWTPPLRELTPETSYGYEVAEFARYVGRPLDPWQEWLVIHAGELLPDGRPRFRFVLVLVARQNGKTELLVVLTLWWLWVERVPLVLGTSTKLEYAAESWKKACRLAKRHPRLTTEIDPRRGIRRANGEQELWRADSVERLSEDGSRYKIAASNAEGGRSLTIHRLVLDELRQHHDYSAHDAAVPATNAVPDAQIWGISNAGSDKSVVLNDLRDGAIKFLEDGTGDHRLGLFEWSAPDGSSAGDIAALAQANPNLGHRIDPDALLGQAHRVAEEGGEALAGFLTENLCMRVPKLDPAVDPDRWAACLDPGDLDDVRDRVAACVDVAPDGQHATLAAAALLPPPPDSDEQPRVRIEVVKAWSGPHATRELRAELPALIRRMRPRVVGWFPFGPSAAIAAELTDPQKRSRRARTPWPPPGVAVEEIRQDAAAVCMGLAEQVTAEQIAQSGDPMLDAHVLGAEKSYRGATWIFARPAGSSAGGHVDGAYAAAGAVHLARTLPTKVGKQRLIVARGDSP